MPAARLMVEDHVEIHASEALEHASVCLACRGVSTGKSTRLASRASCSVLVRTQKRENLLLPYVEDNKLMHKN